MWWCYHKRWISTSGDCMFWKYFHPNWHNMPFPMGQFPLNHGADCGNLGLHLNVRSSYCWQSKTDAGRPMDCPKDTYHILLSIPCAISLMKMFNICSLPVSLHDCSGRESSYQCDCRSWFPRTWIFFCQVVAQINQESSEGQEEGSEYCLYLGSLATLESSVFEHQFANCPLFGT